MSECHISVTVSESASVLEVLSVYEVSSSLVDQGVYADRLKFSFKNVRPLKVLHILNGILINHFKRS